ncbi:MAG: tetratricopeptide repeat protein, partial [Flavobacteriales bacterium]|nr:tetratricopeptide repeat protein [Flavobacteriales bacterium]
MAKTNYLVLLFIFFNSLLFINGLSAQNNLNLTDVDKITYKHYNEQEWDELIQIGNEAIKNGIDFYYLNYRMGIAYYSKKRYRKAIPFFEKVIESTPEDAIAKEYLYYSYLLGSRLGDASKILYTFDEKYRKSIEFHKTKNLFNSLGLEYKYYSFGDFAVNETVNTEVVQKVRNSMNYFSVDLLNYSQNSSTFSFNASFINGNNSVYNIAYSPEVIQEKLKQYQFYVSWKEQIANGLILNFGLTYMRENLQWYDSQYSNGNSTTL